MSLKEILQEKVVTKLRQNQNNHMHFVERIQNESQLLNDFVLPIGKGSPVSFEANGSVKMIVKSGGDMHDEYGLHPHAVYQLGEKLIPNNEGRIATYLKNQTLMNEHWRNELVATILNTHSTNTKHRERVLVREIESEVRGVLSDHYRRLDTKHIFTSFINSVAKYETQVFDAFTDGLKSYIEVINPELVEIPFSNKEHTFVVFGSRISNSDFGDGALDLRSFIMQAVCINGLVTESKIREVHLGRKLPDDLQLSRDTYLYDSRTQASLVSDVVDNIFSVKSIAAYCNKIQDMEDYKVESMDNEIKRLQKVGVQKGEVEQMKEIFIKNDPNDGINGQNSLWKLAQGLSAVARDKDSRRKRELEEISGKLFERIK